MHLKIQPHATETQLQLRNFMINFIKVLLQFGSFIKTTFYTFYGDSVELHIILRKIYKIQYIFPNFKVPLLKNIVNTLWIGICQISTDRISDLSVHWFTSEKTLPPLYFRNKDHWWGLRLELKRLKVYNFLSYHFRILKPIINNNILWNYSTELDKKVCKCYI